MHEPRLMGVVRRALVVVGAVFGVALLSAAVASAAVPVQLKSRMGLPVRSRARSAPGSA